MDIEEERLLGLLHEAYRRARMAKRGTMDEQRFEMNAMMNLAQLTEEILGRTYTPSRGIAFITRKPVIREIFAAPFRDRVVHHLIFNLVAGWWDRRFIYDNYSCRVGKGNLFGIQRLQHHMMGVLQGGGREAWVLKLDIQGYFMSLPRKMLYERAMWGLERQFGKDTWEYEVCKYLWGAVIFDDPTDGVKIRGSARDWADLPKSKSLFHAKEGCGIVIGNLTSQLLSNIYLDQLDRYVRDELGCGRYGRYVDDFYFVSGDREGLLGVVPRVEEYLRGIGLRLHPSKRFLQEAGKGVPFLGAVVYPYRVLPGRRVRVNFRRAVREYDLAGGEALGLGAPEVVSLTSYCGLTLHFRHYRLWNEFRGGGGDGVGY